jgi:hypothetical protein
VTIDDQFAICFSNDIAIAEDLCELDGRVSVDIETLQKTVLNLSNTVQMLQRALAASNKALGVSPVEPYSQRKKKHLAPRKRNTLLTEALQNPTCHTCTS